MIITWLVWLIWFLVAILGTSAVLAVLVLWSTPGRDGLQKENADIERRLSVYREEWKMQNQGPTQEGVDSLSNLLSDPQFNQLVGKYQAKRSLLHKLGIASAWAIGFLLIMCAVLFAIGLAHLFAWL